jgi:hypothetical protein
LQLLIWSVIEPAVTIMAASVPAMRILILKTTTPKLTRRQRVRIREEKKDLEDNHEEEPSNTHDASSRVGIWATKIFRVSWATM